MTDIAAEFRDGQLRWRGNYRSRDDMVRQAQVFLQSASEGSWFMRRAHELAEQCRMAVEAFDQDQWEQSL